MSTELWMLVGSVLVLFAILLLQVVNIIFTIGIVAGVGNREDFPSPMPGLGGRAERAVRNHVEGLAVFAPLVMTAAVTGVSNDLTVLGAELYLAGRIAHAILYLIGVPWIRSLAFGVGVAGGAMILIALIQA